MKLYGKTLVAVAMMLGALGATGCKKAIDAVAPEESADNAPVVDDQAATPEQNALRFGVYFAPREPPPPRHEARPPAPSARHFWTNGYWRWNGRQHVWVSGRWVPRRDRYDYRSPRWERRSGRWVYVRGHWVRR